MATAPRVVQRVLSPARAAMRSRLIATAIELATEGGYDAVGIRQVAAAAGVSVPTVYQHVSSRDQLLMEALMSLGERSTDAVAARPPKGATAAERLGEVFTRILREAGRKPLLYQALYRGYVASAPGLAGADGAPGFGPEQAAWIGATLRLGEGDGLAEDQIATAAPMLSMMFLGAMIGVASGRDHREVAALLSSAAERLLA
ncbi:helix-turn-helix domain-containing protein [Nocardioides sp. AE5]|uniref:TetR/AcrR family transcriptional regulator n=1 Tax=Nocardioides sp. AE5 TaxID=2962573 RepID=UPI002881C456|nr:helix-turn-helix domain-containing protein [Nocardioides sp. AE5]MDT0203134.1 helix-turn-helix domain-containing protein [Nocardioides sp. AE5]